MMEKYELLQEIRTRVLEIANLHGEYLKNASIQDKIKWTKIEINKDIINTLINFNKELGNIVTEILIQERTKEIVGNFEAHDSTDGMLYLVYDFVQQFSKQMDKHEMLYYFHAIFELYFQNLQLQILTLSQEVFGRLIKIVLPYIKLEIVSKNIQTRIVPLKSSVVELFQCISCPKILLEDCYEIVRNEMGTKDFEVIKFELTPLVGGFGFLGDHFKFTIRIKPNETFSFFAKYLPTTNNICEKVALRACKKEEFVYKEVFPLMKIFGINKVSDFAATCYFSRTNDVIVLEDLNRKGLKCAEITIPANYDWMVMVIKQLSSLHASFMILDEKLTQQSGKKNNVEEFFSKYLVEINFDKNESSCWLLTFGANLISEYFIEKLSYISKKLELEEFKQCTRVKVEAMFEHVKKSEKYYNVISHGDMWGSNILSNSSKDCVFVDYQAVRYSPPALDVLFMIYMNTDKEFRLKHMDELLKIYYMNLQSSLEKYSVDISKYYTSKTFYESINYFKSSCIVKALAYLQIILCPREVIKKFNTDEEMAKKFYLQDRRDIHDAAWSYEPFKTRITGLVEDLYEVCENETLKLQVL